MNSSSGAAIICADAPRRCFRASFGRRKGKRKTARRRNHPRIERSDLSRFQKAQKGELVVILADTVQNDIEIVNQYRDETLAAAQKA